MWSFLTETWGHGLTPEWIRIHRGKSSGPMDDMRIVLDRKALGRWVSKFTFRYIVNMYNLYIEN